MPITKQNSKNPKNLQTTQPYPTNLITNDNKNIEQTASLLQKNKSNSIDTPITNKRIKISNEVSPLTIENIIDSIIFSPSPETEISSSTLQITPFSKHIEDTNTSTMNIDPTTSINTQNNSINDSMHAN
ncbi:13667_t:CDS:1 [Funneliformis geosporum]|nr:13667_t:CDS:1 [Funneliformis geosporum]